MEIARPAGSEPRTFDLKQHHDILELVIGGDGATAAKLVRSHIRNSLGAVVTGALEDRERGYAPMAGHSA